MRVRIAELLEKSGKTAYALSQESDGRISTSAIYRLLANDGRARYLDSQLLDALCDVFEVGPGELLEHDGRRTRRR